MDSPFTISLQELPDRESLEKAREEAQERLSEAGSRLARMRWAALRDAAAHCMKSKLGELDPLTTLAKAWGSAVEIQQLAAKTRQAPGPPESYPLGKHKLSASVHPVVTLRCGLVTFPGLTFTVTIEGLVEGAILIFQDGRLHSVEALILTPAAALSYGSKELKRLPGDPMHLTTPYTFRNGGLEIPFS